MKALSITFDNGIDAIPRKLVVYQCGNCGGYCALEPNSGEVFCPYCIVDGGEMRPIQPDNGKNFTGWGFQS